MLLLQTSSEWVNINISVKYVFNDNILSAQLSSARNYFWVTSQDQRRLLAQAHHWILHITAIRGFLKISCIKTHQEDSSQRCCHESVFIENSFFIAVACKAWRWLHYIQSKIQWMIVFWLTLKMFKSANFDLRSSYIFLFNILVKLAATSEIYH